MKEYLIKLIAMNGPISVGQFMNELLFNQQYGYYNKRNPFGKEGDFITAPEISQVFGELIVAYLINIWQNNYPNQEIRLVEMGAGRGVLMRDILLCASKICPDFYHHAKINIIEISPKLEEIQKQNLHNFSINWFRDIESFTKQTNQDQPLFFIANELFDCCPIRQFVMTNKGWVEKLVDCNDKGELDFRLANYDILIDEMVKSLVGNNHNLNSVFEYSQQARSLIEQIVKAIKISGGIGLIIDYGYVENQFKSSLQAVKNHNYCPVFENLGVADITALVDFSSLRDIANSSGLLTSLVSQREFLEALGIRIRQENLLKGKIVAQQQEINSAIERLIDPKQMGELFKFLIIWY